MYFNYFEMVFLGIPDFEKKFENVNWAIKYKNFKFSKSYVFNYLQYDFYCQPSMFVTHICEEYRQSEMIIPIEALRLEIVLEDYNHIKPLLIYFFGQYHVSPWLIHEENELEHYQLLLISRWPIV